MSTQCEAGAGDRWWIPPPGDDESLSSLLSRAAALYERSPERIWASLNQNDLRPTGKVDWPSTSALRRMAAALGKPPSELLHLRERDAPWHVQSGRRRAYCPMCWNEDLRAGRAIYLRRCWSYLLRNQCPLHNFPLSLAPSDWALKRRDKFDTASYGPADQAILHFVERFGRTLEDSMFHRAPWPAGWTGSLSDVRSVLVLVSHSMNTVRDFSPTTLLQPPEPLWFAVHGSRYSNEPLQKLDWESFRWIADPAWRRAALWLTAWEFVPGLTDDLAPGGGRLYGQRSGVPNLRDKYSIRRGRITYQATPPLRGMYEREVAQR